MATARKGRRILGRQETGTQLGELPRCPLETWVREKFLKASSRRILHPPTPECSGRFANIPSWPTGLTEGPLGMGHSVGAEAGVAGACE